MIRRSGYAFALSLFRLYLLTLSSALAGGAAAAFSPAAGAALFAGAAVFAAAAALTAGRGAAAFSARLTEKSLVVCRGASLSRRTVLRCSEVVSVSLVQTPFQRRFSVYTVVVKTYSSAAVLWDIGESGALHLAEALCGGREEGAK